MRGCLGGGRSNTVGPVTGTALAIVVSYSVVVVVGLALALGLWRSTRSGRKPLEHERLARRERSWLVAVVVLLVALLFGTIFFVPYDDSAGARGQVVRVTAQQFGWMVEPATVRAGVPVEFELQSRDVQHGFGIYNADHYLLFQVQVPVRGDTQRAVYTFEQPGTYDVLCIEFCGFGHHLMTSRIEVLPE
jgi:cytochrome c oxidase subunit 2